MKRFLISAFAMCSVMGMNAQGTIINGDLNGDGKITVADISSLTEVLLGKRYPELISAKDANYVNSNGYEFVDLGLPSGTLWLSKTEKAYYAWGEATPKNNFEWSNYSLCNGTSTSINKYNCASASGSVDWKVAYSWTEDPAQIIYLGYWESPTQEQWQELFENTTIVNPRDAEGYMVLESNLSSDKKIRLYAGGTMNGTSATKAGSQASCWTNAVCDSRYDCAYCYTINSDGSWGRYVADRSRGKTISAVINKKQTDIEIESISFPYKNIYVPVGVDHEICDFSISPNNYRTNTIHFYMADATAFPVKDNTVKATGKVKSTTMYAISADGGNKRSGKVTVTSIATGGYDFVDLGLPNGTLWATRNIGAANPTDPGTKYAWGELTTKSSFTKDTYDGPQNSITFYDGEYMLSTKDDVAYSVGEQHLRYPTREEFQELWNNTDHKEVWVDGLYGETLCWEFTSKVNGNKILIPANAKTRPGLSANYWLRDTKSPTSLTSYSASLSFKLDLSIQDLNRYNGYYIRPVLTTVR